MQSLKNTIIDCVIVDLFIDDWQGGNIVEVFHGHIFLLGKIDDIFGMSFV